MIDDYVLINCDEHLELRHKTSLDKPGIYIDFLQGKTQYRLQTSGKKQPLARACALHKQKNLKIIDATAGFGQDAYVLATLGAHVTMLERSKLIVALLEDALNRLYQKKQELMQTFKLIHTDAIKYLENLSVPDYPDIIYLDPMYPEKKKSALNKKQMRILREIVGEDEDVKILFQAAIKRVKQRVVVKRPKYAPNLNNINPTLVIAGNTTRFDIYMPNL